MADSLVKLLFPNQNCHVQSVRLTDSWQQMKASLEAPAPVLRMLGELAAAAALMASGLKFEGALVLQIVGDGPVKLALVEVRSGLKIRATVQMRAGMEVPPNATFKDMVNANGKGRCAAILDLADRRPNEDPYQGVVPLTGNTVAETLEGFMTMFSSSETVIDLGVRYSRIIFLFTIAIMANLYFEKVFQAVGRMKVTMTGMMIGCIVNIILDPLIIFGIGPFPRLGIEGAALATGIGQVTPVVIYWIIYKIRPISVKIHPEYLKEGKNLVGRLYAIGVPAILNLALPSLLISALNGILAVYSQSYVVVLGIYYKLQTFIYLTANGIVQGMRPIIGFNYGAGEHKRVRKIYEITLIMCAVIMLIGTGICLAIPEQLIGLFSSNPETIRLGGQALTRISAGFLISAVSITSSGALEGLGKGGSSLIISLCRNVIVILPAAYLLSHLGGGVFVWHAFWITEVISAAVSLVVYRRAVRR